MELYVNERGVQAGMRACLPWANEILLVSCYTDGAWMNGVVGLATWCDAGHGKLRILLGDDPKYEQATQLLDWAKRRKRGSVLVHRTTIRSTRKLHAKVFLFRGEARSRAFVGSANLTQRGLRGAPKGNVEAGVALERPEALGALWQFAEEQWRRSKPLRPQEPPPPPPPPSYEEYVLRQIEAGQFWIREFRQGGTVVSLPREVFGLERRSASAGNLRLVEDGQVQWEVLRPDDIRAIRNAQARARDSLDHSSLDAGPWGQFVTAQGAQDWNEYAGTATAEFDARVDRMLEEALDQEVRLKELKREAQAAYRQLRGAKRRLPKNAWEHLAEAATTSLETFVADVSRRPKLLFHLNPIAMAKLRGRPVHSDGGQAYLRLFETLLMGSLLRTRRLFVDGADERVIRPLMLVADARMEAYLNSLPGGPTLPTKPQQLSTRDAVRKARRDLRTLGQQRHVDVPSLSAWVGRFTRWES